MRVCVYAMPSYAKLALFFVSLSKKLHLHCSSLPSSSGGLVSSGEAAHPALTSMDIWCKLHGKAFIRILAQWVKIPSPLPVRYSTAPCWLLVPP